MPRMNYVFRRMVVELNGFQSMTRADKVLYHDVGATPTLFTPSTRSTNCLSCLAQSLLNIRPYSKV